MLIYWLTRRGVLTLNGETQGILLILVFGAATDYALLLVARYREELTRDETAFDAMRLTLCRSVEPTGASGGTVILGMLCLLLSELTSNRSLGPITSIGIVGALLASLTFLPAALVLLGPGRVLADETVRGQASPVRARIFDRVVQPGQSGRHRHQSPANRASAVRTVAPAFRPPARRARRHGSAALDDDPADHRSEPDRKRAHPAPHAERQAEPVRREGAAQQGERRRLPQRARDPLQGTEQHQHVAGEGEGGQPEQGRAEQEGAAAADPVGEPSRGEQARGEGTR